MPSALWSNFSDVNSRSIQSHLHHLHFDWVVANFERWNEAVAGEPLRRFQNVYILGYCDADSYDFLELQNLQSTTAASAKSAGCCESPAQHVRVLVANVPLDCLGRTVAVVVDDVEAMVVVVDAELGDNKLHWLDC